MRQLQECGDPSGKRPHGVRRIYATPAQDEGHNIKTLSERIGHAHVTVTGKIYIHKSRGTDRSMSDAMGALIERLAAGTEALDEPLGTDLGTAGRNTNEDRPAKLA